MNGSWTKKLTFIVFALRNGSIRAVAGSGSSIMSDSLIDWKPRTDEPSNARPSSNTSSSNAEAGDREVLHDTGQVAESDVDVLDTFLLDALE